MTIREFEAAVWDIEGIRIVVRADPNEQVGHYDYERAATQASTLNEWLERRIYPKIGDYKVEVIGGNGKRPHGGTLVSTISASYNA